MLSRGQEFMRSGLMCVVTVVCYLLGESLGQSISDSYEILTDFEEYFGSTGRLIIETAEYWLGWLTGTLAHFYLHRLLWSDEFGM